MTSELDSKNVQTGWCILNKQSSLSVCFFEY